MFSKRVLPVLAAAAGLASAATTDICKQDTFTINSQADISALGKCTTLTGNVVIGNQTDTALDLSGFKTIDGDLSLLNNKLVTTLRSDTITSISGAFHLQNLTMLSTLAFSSLTSVGSIYWASLTALDVLTFTAGIKSAKSIVVADTFLRSLDGVDVSTADTININNNHRLAEYTSSITNLTTLLNINANGLDLAVDFPNLVWIANMTISNVSSFSVPSLKVVNGSASINSNFFKSFSAPNLTATTSGDLSFSDNSDLTNVSLPVLTSIGGGFLIKNNIDLKNVTGFPKLKSVGGAINMRGNFTEIELPALNDVKGAFDIVSTSDISDSCAAFKKLAPSTQGGAGQIQGKFTCDSNITNAGSVPTSTSTASGTKSTGTDSAATGINVNSLAVLALAGVAVVAQML